MRRWSFRSGAALAVALFALPITSHAEPGAPVSDSQTNLATQVARLMYADYDWGSRLSRTNMDQLTANSELPAGWGAFVKQAAAEEASAGPTEIVPAIGRYMAHHWNADELRAGLALMQSPAGDFIAKDLARNADDPKPVPSDAARKAIAQSLATPNGKAFIEHLDSLGRDPVVVNDYILPAFTLGFVSRLADDLMASDAYKTARRGPQTDAERLTVEAVNILFRDVDLRASFSQGFDASGFAGMTSRPAWADVMTKAAADEFSLDEPMVMQSIGLHLAPTFTVPELNAALAVIRGPGGPALSKLIADAAAGRHPNPTPEAERAVAQITRTAAGRGFMAKFGHIGALGKAAAPDVEEIVLPDVLKRFADAAWAEEVNRAD